MFARRTRGLFEFSMALLCLWAAYWHTPVGALLRLSVAKVFGVQSSARPLLAYYSGSASPHSGDGVRVPPELTHLARGVVITEELALGLGLHASLRGLPPEKRRHAYDLARAHGVTPPEGLVDVKAGPLLAERVIARAAAQLGSKDAALLALFAGVEPARYAQDRARAEGLAAPQLEELARHLPPGFEDEVVRAQDALSFGIAYGLGWPLPERTQVSSRFGQRVHPVLGMTKRHTGVDLAVPVGTPVAATAAGVVMRASEDGVNGKVLVIDHGRGVTTAYCHNSKLLVAAGELVARDAVIALSGNTGRSTGPHLHYQLELAGEPVDPLAFHPSHPLHLAGGAEP